jgi:SMI1-KNR4 cell-wall
MTFDDVVQVLLSFRHRTLGEGATDNEIEAASMTLGVPIRGGYRMFLQRFGYGGVADFELFGVGHSVPTRVDLVDLTQSERTAYEPNIPHHLLPIMNNGGGDHACLDTRASPEEPPVVWWWHEDGPEQVPEQDAPDFVTWLARRLEERNDER